MTSTGWHLNVAAQFGGKVYESREALFADVDLVDVRLGHGARRYRLRRGVGGQGRDLRKTLARRLKDAERMVATCEEAGVSLYPAHVVRFFPEYAQAKATLDSGALGKAGVLRTVRAGSFPRRAASFMPRTTATLPRAAASFWTWASTTLITLAGALAKSSAPLPADDLQRGAA